MTVRRRKGVWYVDFRYDDPVTGERTRFKRSTGRGTTKKEALALERAWLRELTTPPEPESKEAKSAAFSGFARYWLDVHVRVNGKPSYQRSVESDLRVHLVPYFGDRDLRAIDPELIETYKAAKVRSMDNPDGRSPKTVNNHLGVLSSLFTAAVRWGYADVNPCHAVPWLKLPPRELRFWDREQSQAFLDAMARLEPAWHPLFLAALRTGMRQGELFALHWDDVDFVRGRIDVRLAFSEGELTHPKSGRGRQVPMTEDLARVLKAKRHLRGPLVFCREDGSRHSQPQMLKPMTRVRKAVGLPRITFHDLRHSFASQLVMAGVPLKVVQEYLGHADIQMTMRYAHLSPESRDRWIGVLDGARSHSGPSASEFTPREGRSGGRGR